MQDKKFIKLIKSKDKKTKYTAIFMNRQTNKLKQIKFGAYNYSDFTKHKDNERKQRYIARHSKMGEDWTNPLTRGYWSRWLLWNLPTIKASLMFIKKDLKNKGFL